MNDGNDVQDENLPFLLPIIIIIFISPTKGGEREESKHGRKEDER